MIGTFGFIEITTDGGMISSNPDIFTVTAPTPPTITSISPTSGIIGTEVTISGDNFTGATSVEFNGVAATPTVLNDGNLTVIVPAGATTGTIEVFVPGFSVVLPLTTLKPGFCARF